MLVKCSRSGEFKCCKFCAENSTPPHAVPHKKVQGCCWGECILAMGELKGRQVVRARCVKVKGGA